MKRYYLCPVVTSPDPEIGRYLKIRDYGVSYTAVIADGLNWGLAIVAASNFTAVDGDTALDKLPEITMDATLNTIPSGQRNRVLNRLGDLGVDTSGITASTTFRELLEVIGRHLDLNFNTGNFDVSDT